jgi:hypothetical protein
LIGCRNDRPILYVQMLAMLSCLDKALITAA